MTDYCIACHRPLERNPLSGHMTCFLHPCGEELVQINQIRANMGRDPLPEPEPERYASGHIRPSAMANLPDWALAQFLRRHTGPALETAKDEALHRAWDISSLGVAR